MKVSIKSIFILLVLILSMNIVSAQPGGGGGGGGGFGDEPDDNGPIDGGISLLVAAAGIYGAKKAFNKKK
ncbi:MAG: hypothetical protein V4538_11370 [Bacteroidota bacterium]